MTDDGMDAVLQSLDDLSQQVRRQGRAAIAAQAAAERCLEALNDRPPEEDGPKVDEPGGEEWLRAVIPVADALDRLAASAEAMASQAHSGRLPWPFRRAAAPADELTSLTAGLRVLRGQLRAALQSVGAEVLRPRGELFDAHVHRAVEVQAGEPERVIEVLRPGYLLDGRVVREAEVVVGSDAVGSRMGKEMGA